MNDLPAMNSPEGLRYVADAVHAWVAIHNGSEGYSALALPMAEGMRREATRMEREAKTDSRVADLRKVIQLLEDEANLLEDEEYKPPAKFSVGVEALKKAAQFGQGKPYNYGGVL